MTVTDVGAVGEPLYRYDAATGIVYTRTPSYDWPPNSWSWFAAPDQNAAMEAAHLEAFEREEREGASFTAPRANGRAPAGAAYLRVKGALAALDRPIRDGMARCPAHDDRRPSLSVRQGRVGALLHCFAQCRTADVLRALGLTWSDLFDRPRADKPSGNTDGSAAKAAITLSGRQIDEVVDDAIAALVAANDPPELFVRGGGLVRVIPDEDARSTIRDAGADCILERLYAAASWWRPGANGPIAAEPPRRVAVALRERLAANADRLPPLRGIITAPILRPDGSILATPGYDAATRLVYAPPDDLRLPPIPDAPTSADLARATSLVSETLVDFPFVTEADRATAWALLIGVVLREVIAGHVPLHAITAPSQGTGKGLLMDALLCIATGRRAAISAMPEGQSSGDEMRKRITTIIAAGRAVAVLDNLTRAIDSPALAAVLTAERWVDRVLGFTNEIELPNRTIWIATGNNVTVRGDFARRTIWCRLDAKVARPWTRDGWRHPDLLAWVTDRRGELLAAVLTIARGWVVAGRPGPGDAVPVLGGYGPWRHVVGGVLRIAGVPGLLGQAAMMYDEADEETPAWTAFLVAWQTRFVSPIAVAELVEALRRDVELAKNAPPMSELAQALPAEVAGALGRQRANVRIGSAIRSKAGKRFPLEGGESIWVEREGKDRSAKAVRWAVRCG